MVAALSPNPRDGAIAALAIPALGTLAMDPLVSITNDVFTGMRRTSRRSRLRTVTK